MAGYNIPTYPYNSAGNPPVPSTSSTFLSLPNTGVSQELSHIALSTSSTTTTSSGMDFQQSMASNAQSLPTSPNHAMSVTGCANSNSQNLMPSSERSPSNSPQNSRSPMVGASGCDSTTCSDAAAPMEQAKEDSLSGTEESADVQEDIDIELHYYTTRYVQ